jgi:hypothetical protein
MMNGAVGSTARPLWVKLRRIGTVGNTADQPPTGSEWVNGLF